MSQERSVSRLSDPLLVCDVQNLHAITEASPSKKRSEVGPRGPRLGCQHAQAAAVGCDCINIK